MNKKLQVGDVFKAKCLGNPNFVRYKFGDRDKNGWPLIDPSEIQIDPGMHPCTGFYAGPIHRSVNLDATEDERGNAEFVVVKTSEEGGGTGHGPHDVYPDGWHVYAVRLTKDGKWDEHGEKVDFYQSGCFRNEILPKDITFVRKMTMKFVTVFEDEKES